MGQVLGFAHCKEAPSTASTTPDSTEGGNEEPDFPLQAAPEPPEEEEEDEGGGNSGGGTPGPPRELTFSYIAFSGGGGPPNEPGPRSRRDSRRGRPLRLSSGGPPQGLDPHLAPRAPPRHPEEPPAPPEGQLEVGGPLPELGCPETEETPMSLAAAPPADPPPPAPPSLPSGGTHRPPPPAPPPDPPPEPPPAPPDQSPSPQGADVLVWELLYWRAPGRSALALAGALGTLGCLARFSAVSVGAYGALAVLGVTLPLRLHRAALRALRRHPPERHPPEHPPTQLAGAVGLSPEEQQRWARRLARHVTAATRTLARLFLVHSLPESLKFAFLFYLLTYVGAVCNGLTLLGAGVICAFTFPVLYRHHQAQIDQYVSLVRNHLSHLRARILAKLPSAKVKPQ
ncbi:LOW QUALITY PROTEIN: reticulon-2-like [Rhynochetos jubatus]